MRTVCVHNILRKKLIPTVIHPEIVTCLGGKIQILLYVENYREFELPIHKRFFHCATFTLLKDSATKMMVPF